MYYSKLQQQNQGIRTCVIGTIYGGVVSCKYCNRRGYMPCNALIRRTGYVCSRIIGHKGDHVACGSFGHIYARGRKFYPRKKKEKSNEIVRRTTVF